MQYEDSAGCLWTEHDGEDGYVYYFNTQTKASGVSDKTLCSYLDKSYCYYNNNRNNNRFRRALGLQLVQS